MTADGAWICLALVAWPLVAALVLALTPGGGRTATRLATVAALVELGLVGLVILTLDTPPATIGGGPLPAAQLAFRTQWLPVSGSELFLAIDGLNQYALLALAAVLVLAVVAESREPEGAHPARLALALAAAGGVVLLLLARDLLLAAAGHGLAAVALAGLVGIGAGRTGVAAARRFASFAVSGSLLLAAAAAVSGAQSGSTVIDELAISGPAQPELGALLFCLTVALQIPLVPFHTWLVPVCVSGSTSSRILIAGVWCGAGVFGLLRFGLALYPTQAMAAAPWPAWWAVGSAVFGAILALVQGHRELSRRVAWVVLASGGIMAAGALGLGNLQATGTSAFGAAQALPRATLLLLAVWIGRRRVGGHEAAVCWLALALIVAVAPGGGPFAGWLALLVGQAVASPALAWTMLGATAALGLALLAPVVGLTRGEPSPAPGFLRWSVAAVVVVAAVTGLRPQPLLTWARPDIERLLSSLPDVSAPRAPADGEETATEDEDADATDAALPEEPAP